MKALDLRDYQQDALDSVIRNYNSGISSQLLVIPTGGGKTIIMSAIAEKIGQKTLILAHRDELINQIYEKIVNVYPESQVGICKAKRNELDKTIVIGSVQTCSQNKRLKQLRKQNYRVLIIDEAHHAASGTYKKIVAALGFNTSRKLLVGLTATPNRHDKISLDNIFKKVAYKISITELIDKGYLSPLKGLKIETTISLKNIKSHNGDFNSKSLSYAINTPERNKIIADSVALHSPNRKMIAFCADVKHSVDLAQTFINNGIPAAAVWGSMPLENRKKVLDDFRKGTIKILTSCALLIEGFDEPTVDGILMCRPTKSNQFYTQAIGRGLRIATGKQDCLVIDFADNSCRIENIVTLDSTIKNTRVITHKKTRTNYDAVEEVYSGQSFYISSREFELLIESRLIWVDLGDNQFSLSSSDGYEIIIDQDYYGYVAHYYYKNNIIEHEFIRRDTLSDCIKACEKFALNNLKIDYANQNSAWFKKAKTELITPGQKNYLSQQNIHTSKLTSKADASILIRKVVAKKSKLDRARKSTSRNLPSIRSEYGYKQKH